MHQDNTQDYENKSIVFRFPVHPTIEAGDSPEYVEWNLMQKHIRNMDNSRRTLSLSGFEIGIKELIGDTEWSDQDDFRVKDQELCINKFGHVWLSGRPKHADFNVETRPILIDDLQKLWEVAVEFDADCIDFYNAEDPGDNLFFLKDEQTIASGTCSDIFGINGLDLEDIIHEARQNNLDIRP